MTFPSNEVVSYAMPQNLDECSLAESASLSLRPEEHWPAFGEDEIAAVASVLRSGNVNQWTGPEVFAFQEACTSRFGGGKGIALANGSVALELALRAFGIGPGDEVVVSPRSFVASASCAMLVGATPIFADVDLHSGNITAATIARVLTNRTRAIIPVHLAGWPAEMPAIMDLARSYGLRVIEDCAQAHGAQMNGQSVGSFGDAAAFSFCQDKIISTGGEGGFTSFRDTGLWEWAWSFKDHGKNRSKALAEAGPPGRFRWVHDRIGTNWRITGTQAAIGLLQLQKLDDWSAIRNRNAEIWSRALCEIKGLRLPVPTGNIRRAFYKLYFYINEHNDERAAALRGEILARSAEAGLRVFSGSCSEIFLEGAFSALPRPYCPIAQSLGARSLMVEVHPTLDPELLQLRAERLASIVRQVLGK